MFAKEQEIQNLLESSFNMKAVEKQYSEMGSSTTLSFIFKHKTTHYSYHFRVSIFYFGNTYMKNKFIGSIVDEHDVEDRKLYGNFMAQTLQDTVNSLFNFWENYLMTKESQVKIADIETPYMGKDEDTVQRNILYARLACGWALRNGYIPYASHLFFTQPGLLDDDVPEERARGIQAGKDLIRQTATHTLLFKDLGISSGMAFGKDDAVKAGREITEIYLFPLNSHASTMTFEELKQYAKAQGVLSGDYTRKGW